MTFRGLQDLYTRLREPTLNPGNRFLGRERSLVEPGIGADSDKCDDDWPAQTHRRGTTQLGIPPGPCMFVLLREAIFRVEQKVSIDKDQE